MRAETGHFQRNLLRNADPVLQGKWCALKKVYLFKGMQFSGWFFPQKSGSGAHGLSQLGCRQVFGDEKYSVLLSASCN
jgi:hypothetical protein